MERFFGYTRLLTTGAPVASAAITVYDVGTLNLSTIYDDDGSPPTAKANPFTADANGYFHFYAVDGRYDVQISGGAIPTPYTWGDVALRHGQNTVPIPEYAIGSLPAAGTSGRLARVTDDVRGVWQDQGEQWVSLSGQVVNAREFNAKGDGSTDDTAALQAAVDAAIANEGRLFIPPGDYLISAQIDIDGPIHIEGHCSPGETTSLVPNSTYIKATTATQDVFRIDTDQAVAIRDLAIGSTVAKTLGAAIHVGDTTSGSIGNQLSRFENILFRDPYIGINSVEAARWKMLYCEVEGPKEAGVKIDNTLSEDSGDIQIVGNNFSGPVGDGIQYHSAGSLRVVGNKFLGGQRQFDLNLRDAVTTSQLVITGNAFDGAVVNSIRLTHQGASPGLFTEVSIVGNVFTSNEDATHIELDRATNHLLSRIIIEGNVIFLGVSGTCISLNNPRRLMVMGNHMAGPGGVVTGISITGTIEFVVFIGPNNFDGLGTNIVNAGPASGVTYMMPTNLTFADLVTMNDGSMAYCTDCTKATPCAGGGNGALAKRINGAWDCD
jgi:hypothetical protein